jgi:hypothetical protein
VSERIRPSDPLELSQEKRRDYQKTVLLQLIILVCVLLLEDFCRLFAWPLPYTLLKLIFFGLFGLYLYALWDMLRNFTLRRWLIQAVATVIAGSLSTLFVVDVALDTTIRDYPTVRLLCHCALFLVQVVVAGFALRDLFSGSASEIDKLWGSACIFFMSGFVFGGLYFCVLLKDPLAFGQRLPEEYWGLFEALYLSLTALVGLDNNAYPDCTRLVRNIILMEGAWSQLYMVLLIGRLLSKDAVADLGLSLDKSTGQPEASTSDRPSGT